MTPMLSHSPNQESMNMAVKKSKRRDWTKDDVREFKALARKRTPAAKIAKTFKRTVGAVRQKALRMGMSLDSRAAR